MKKISLIFLICGFLAMVATVIATSAKIHGDTVGIIGGADGPTAIFVTRSLNGMFLTLFLFGAAIFVSGMFALIFNKTVKVACGVKTTLVSLGISAGASLGSFAFVMFASCFFLSNPDKHPIRYPASVMIGILSLLAVTVLVCAYVKLRRENKSVKGVLMDIAIMVVYYFPFLILCNSLYNAVFL